jgi:hypothetical protein
MLCVRMIRTWAILSVLSVSSVALGKEFWVFRDATQRPGILVH